MLCFGFSASLSLHSTQEMLAQAVEQEVSEQDASSSPPPDNPFHYFSAEQTAESDTGHLSSELMKLVGSVVLFTVILLLLNWMLKRINSNRLAQLNATSEIRVLEKRVLSHKAFIYLIEIRGKTIAIAESSAGIAKLTEFSDIEERV